MQKLAVMGGTFNPIHIAHLQMAEASIREFGCDKVLFMTSGNPPHKRNKSILNASVRFEMTHLAIEDNPLFFDSDYEIQKESYSYTAQTMEMLNQKYAGSVVYFIIGADSLKDLPKWKDAEKLFAITNFLVFPRKGLSIPIDSLIGNYQEKFGAKITPIAHPVMQISSTYVRSLMHKGNWEAVKKFLPSKVFCYIKAHHLYE